MTSGDATPVDTGHRLHAAIVLSAVDDSAACSTLPPSQQRRLHLLREDFASC